jgi:hypothetical protein
MHAGSAFAMSKSNGMSAHHASAAGPSTTPSQSSSSPLQISVVCQSGFPIQSGAGASVSGPPSTGVDGNVRPAARGREEDENGR